MDEDIKIYTDGSSLGNPGPGGWGTVVIEKDKIIHEIGGFDRDTTNNKMELKAAIEALKYINKNYKNYKNKNISIFVDSNYVLLGITSWIKNWEKNGWRTAGKKEVMNQDLWKELMLLSDNSSNKITWKKVKGHFGEVYNERADEIATKSASLQQIHIF